MRLVRPSCVVNSIHRPPGSSIALPSGEMFRGDTLTIGRFSPRRKSETREVGADGAGSYRIWWHVDPRAPRGRLEDRVDHGPGRAGDPRARATASTSPRA